MTRGAKIDKLWHAAAPGLLTRLAELTEESLGAPNSRRRSGTCALQANDGRRSTFFSEGPTSTGFPTTQGGLLWTRRRD